MATLNLEGRPYEIAPYKIGALRRAAVHVDAMNTFFKAKGKELAARQQEITDLPEGEERDAALAAMSDETTIADMMAPIEIFIEILAIGMQKIDPKYTAAYMAEEMIGFSEQRHVIAVTQELLAESGLGPKGEVKAPPAPEPEGASLNNSETSSAS